MSLAMTIYTTVGLTAGTLGLVGGMLLQHRIQGRARVKESLLHAAIERPSRGLRRQRPSGSVPEVQRATGGAPLAMLEGHLRQAVLSADARERLIGDALRRTGGDRAAATRKVLNDLNTENNRWS